MATSWLGNQYGVYSQDDLRDFSDKEIASMSAAARSGSLKYLMGRQGGGTDPYTVATSWLSAEQQRRVDNAPPAPPPVTAPRINPPAPTPGYAPLPGGGNPGYAPLPGGGGGGVQAPRPPPQPQPVSNALRGGQIDFFKPGAQGAPPAAPRGAGQIDFFSEYL